jgi:CBS domain containing-hemolysin-like protein
VGAVGVVAVTVVPLLAMVLLGEVLPKLAANTFRVAMVKVIALPLAGVYPVVGPAARMVSRWIVEPIGRLLAPAPKAGSADRLDTAELEAMLEMSRQRGVIGTEEQQLIRQVLTLSQLKVRDIMIPRVDLVAIDVTEPAEALASLARRTGLGKVLAIDGDIDHVLGVIYVRQFMLASRRGPVKSLRSLVRNVRFVPEILRVDQLLDDFRGTGTKLAIAVDEYGGTAGLVTLKDVVERMVGDVDMDEVVAGMPLDSPEPMGEGRWRVSGRLSVHDWEEAFGTHELPRRVSTVGGLVMALLGRVPRTGDVAQLANLSMEVERMDGDRVESVVLKLNGGTGEGEKR